METTNQNDEGTPVDKPAPPDSSVDETPSIEETFEILDMKEAQGLETVEKKDEQGILEGARGQDKEPGSQQETDKVGQNYMKETQETETAEMIEHKETLEEAGGQDKEADNRRDKEEVRHKRIKESQETETVEKMEYKDTLEEADGQDKEAISQQDKEEVEQERIKESQETETAEKIKYKDTLEENDGQNKEAGSRKDKEKAGQESIKELQETEKGEKMDQHEILEEADGQDKEAISQQDKEEVEQERIKESQETETAEKIKYKDTLEEANGQDKEAGSRKDKEKAGQESIKELQETEKAEKIEQQVILEEAGGQNKEAISRQDKEEVEQERIKESRENETAEKMEHKEALEEFGGQDKEADFRHYKEKAGQERVKESQETETAEKMDQQETFEEAGRQEQEADIRHDKEEIKEVNVKDSQELETAEKMELGEAGREDKHADSQKDKEKVGKESVKESQEDEKAEKMTLEETGGLDKEADSRQEQEKVGQKSFKDSRETEIAENTEQQESLEEAERQGEEPGEGQYRGEAILESVVYSREDKWEKLDGVCHVSFSEDSDASPRPCLLEILRDKALKVDGEEITSSNVRYATQKTCEGIAQKTVSCIIISYVEEQTRLVTHRFLEMQEEQDKKLAEFLSRLLKQKHIEDEDDSSDKECFDLANKQPVYFGVVNVVVLEVSDKSQIHTGRCVIVLDVECLSIYPVVGDKLDCPHLLMFWQMEGETSVEKILHYAKDHKIAFETATRRYEMPVIGNIIRQLSELKPKPKHVLADKAELREWLSKPERTRTPPAREPQFPAPAETRMTASAAARDRSDHEMLTLPSVASGYDERAQGLDQGMLGASLEERYQYQEQQIETKSVRDLKRELEDALTSFEGNDDMRMIWITLEDDINTIISGGTVPETDPFSGGLNPDSGEHLKKALSDVADQLSEQKLDIAVSRIQAARKIFEGSKNEEIVRFFLEATDMQLLQKLYFRSLLQ